MQVHANGGILSESEYPYAAGTSGAAGKCRASDPSVQPAVTITGYVDLPASAAGQLIDEEELRAMVAERPVAVAVEGDQHVFQMYKSGVLDVSNDECGTKVDHAVLVVGYGTDNGLEYWKIKNSWGTSWGEDGYYRIVEDSNACGVATDVVHSAA